MHPDDRFVLWDIDGTLIDGGGVGSEVFDVAIDRTIGRRPSQRLDLSGMTDPQIVVDYLEMLEVPAAEIPSLLPIVLGHVETGMAAAAGDLRTRGRMLPGVFELLPRTAG